METPHEACPAEGRRCNSLKRNPNRFATPSSRRHGDVMMLSTAVARMNAIEAVARGPERQKPDPPRGCRWSIERQRAARGTVNRRQRYRTGGLLRVQRTRESGQPSRIHNQAEQRLSIRSDSVKRCAGILEQIRGM